MIFGWLDWPRGRPRGRLIGPRMFLSPCVGLFEARMLAIECPCVGLFNPRMLAIECLSWIGAGGSSLKGLLDEMMHISSSSLTKTISSSTDD